MDITRIVINIIMIAVTIVVSVNLNKQGVSGLLGPSYNLNLPQKWAPFYIACNRLP